MKNLLVTKKNISKKKISDMCAIDNEQRVQLICINMFCTGVIRISDT